MTESVLTATVELTDGMAFQADTGSGHSLAMDAAPEVGGANCGSRPMEMLLVGLGGCTGMDVISILRKMRRDVTGYEVRLRGERAADHPRVFTTIFVEHDLEILERYAERAVAFDSGRILADGPVAGVLAQAEVRRAVLGED